MTTVLIGLIVYLVLSLLGWACVAMSRPPTCSKGHTDFYHCNRWCCRVCTTTKQQRMMRKLIRERNRATR